MMPKNIFLTKAFHVLKMLCFRCFYFSSRSHSTTGRGTTTGPLLYRISFRIWKSSSGHLVCLAWLLSLSCSFANQWIKWYPRTYWPYSVKNDRRPLQGADTSCRGNIADISISRRGMIWVGWPSTLLYPVSLLSGCWDRVQGGNPL